MSYSTVLSVTPNRRPLAIAQLDNAHGWSPSIWRRLLVHHGYDEHWRTTDDTGLTHLWQSIETLPEWQQAPLVLTFDTGVIPYQAFRWAATQLEAFENQLPAPEGHVNHVPAMIELLRSQPDTPLLGVHGTSVTENPFDPWDDEADKPGSGLPLSGMYVLDRHADFVAEMEAT